MRSLLAAVIGLTACGGGVGRGGAGGGGGTLDAGFHPGQECTGDLVCSGPNSALYCEPRFATPAEALTAHRRLVEYPCPGPNACLSNATTVLCDIKDSAIGTPCPEFQRAHGFCRPDAGQIVVCVDAGWEARPCKCRETNGSLFCDP